MNLNSLEDASVSDVAQLLQNGGIPSDTIEIFTGELAHAQHCLALTASYVFHLLVYTCIENEVDGQALEQLIKDVQEFCLLIPQAGLRLKVKSVIKKVFFAIMLC